MCRSAGVAGRNDYPINGRLLLYIFLYSVFTVEINYVLFGRMYVCCFC